MTDLEKKKTKTITKEFWVSDIYMDHIKRSLIFNVCKTQHAENKITISFEMPEKQVTISESEFDDFRGYWILENRPFDYHTYLKQKLFGDKE